MNRPPARPFVHQPPAERATLKGFRLDPPATAAEAQAASSLAFIFGGLVPAGTPDRVVAASVLMLMAATFDTPDIVWEARDAIGAPARD